MGKSTIATVNAVEAYSDRGTIGIEVVVKTENGKTGKALCSRGLSIGPYEFPTPYDGEKRFRGLGLKRVVEAINTIAAPALIGMEATNQKACDETILSLGKNNFGAIGTTALSEAILKTGAECKEVPLYRHIAEKDKYVLPVPSHIAATGSLRYGGPETAGGKPSYAFVAYDYPTYSEASYALWEVLMDWTDVLSKKLSIRMTMDSGLMIPIGKIKNDYMLWDMMAETIAKAGQEGKIGIQIDMAAGQFYNKKSMTYYGIFEKKELTKDEMIAIVKNMSQKYPFVIIEDPLCADDFDGFAEITRNVDIQIVGDEIFATNATRLLKGINKRAGNCILAVPGHVGTVSETIDVVNLAKDHGFGVTVSGSRGEDVEVCDFSVAFGCGTIRECGLSYSGNRLLKIEEELGDNAIFLGKSSLCGNRFVRDSKRRGDKSEDY